MAEVKSLKINSALNMIRTLLGLLFPLITFPYVSRVLLPEGLGKISFVLSVVLYFVMFSYLGIPVYGIREVGKLRNEKEKLSIFFNEIFIINFSFMLIALIVYIILLFTHPVFLSLKGLFILAGLVLIFNSIGIEWLYQGLEEYKYITTRSFIIQFLSIFSLFYFVKTKDDFFKYAAILVFSVIGNNIINLLNARQYFRRLPFSELQFRKHISPILMLFAVSVIMSLYTNLNSVMLGLFCNNVAVGLYSVPLRVTSLVSTIISSVGLVLLARLSYKLAQNDQHAFNSLLRKSSDLLWMIALPSSIGLFMLSKEIILVFSGYEFISAVASMKILAPTVFAFTMSSFIGIQILVPTGKEKLTLYSVIIGALLNLLVNILFLQKYSFIGASYGLLAAELSVMFAQFVFARKTLKDIFWTRDKLKSVIASVAIIFCIILIKSLLSSVLITVITCIILSAVVYAVSQLIMKNEIALEMISVVRKLVKRKEC